MALCGGVGGGEGRGRYSVHTWSYHRIIVAHQLASILIRLSIHNYSTNWRCQLLHIKTSCGMYIHSRTFYSVPPVGRTDFLTCMAGPHCYRSQVRPLPMTLGTSVPGSCLSSRPHHPHAWQAHKAPASAPGNLGT